MKRIIATVGPSLFNDIPLTEVQNWGIFTESMEHMDQFDDIENLNICEIRTQVPDSEILMDLPGNKVIKSYCSLAIAIKVENFLL